MIDFVVLSTQFDSTEVTPIEASIPTIEVDAQDFFFERNSVSSLSEIAILTALGIVAIAGVANLIRSALCICKPNEVLILAGRQWKRKDGRQQGYRVIHGGRALRVPVVETIKRMDLTTMPVRVEVHNAYSKGGIPLNIQAIANIRISDDPTLFAMRSNDF